MKKNLLITFDYELFLGNRSGTIHDCMIDPTRKLVALMQPYGIRAVFFVDTTYLLRLQEEGQRTEACARDFKTVADQLRALVAAGHYVFPHIHPHWLDAIYLADKNQWRLNDVTKYRFHALTETERSQVFDGSVKLLQEILCTEFPDYPVNAFRAGGWCIQPFSDFIPYFKKHHFKYEFSVLGGIYQFTDAQFFDFSDAPAAMIYRFESDICKADPNGTMVQYVISSIDVPAAATFLHKVWLKFQYKVLRDHSFTRGEGQPSRNIQGHKPVNASGHDLATPGKERICVEDLTIAKLGLYNRFIDRNDYMHFISHPKMITGHNLTMFGRFLKRACNQYQIESDFQKMEPLNGTNS